MLTSFSNFSGSKNNLRVSSDIIPSLFEEQDDSVSTDQINEFRKLLESGMLVESIDLTANDAILNLTKKYKGEDNFHRIIKMFTLLRTVSVHFQELFQVYSQKGYIVLGLKEGHYFKNGEEVLEALRNYARPTRLNGIG